MQKRAVHARAIGDLLHPRAVLTLAREHRERRVEDLLLGAFGLGRRGFDAVHRCPADWSVQRLRPGGRAWHFAVPPGAPSSIVSGSAVAGIADRSSTSRGFGQEIR